MMRALFLAAALAACASEAPPAPAAFTLDGTSWARADDDQAAPHFPTLEFRDGGVGGYSGCNRWFGAVRISGNAMRFTGVGGTEMACAAPAMAAEQRMYLALNSTAAFRADAAELVLMDTDGVVIARFVRND